MKQHPDEITEYTAFVANWNGDGVIERCLASILAAARAAKIDLQLFVTDDASTDGSAETVARLFPEAELVRIEQNAGYAEAVNLGMRRIRSPWVFLFNNDLVVEPDYFTRLIRARGEAEAVAGTDGVFCIGAKTLEWETLAPNHAGMNPEWRFGMLSQVGFEARELSESGFVQAGACLVNRGKFNALGGFAPVFHPGYWEDYDICFQALQRGWRNFYEPRAAAFHWGKRSMRGKLGAMRLRRTILRNHFLFNWIGAPAGWGIVRHLAMLPLIVFRNCGEELTNDPLPPGARALTAALGRLPMVLRIRRERVAVFRKPDSKFQ